MSISKIFLFITLFCSTQIIFNFSKIIEDEPIRYRNRTLPLQGERLKCCVVVSSPFIWRNINKDPPYEGWSFENFEILRRQAGFTCKPYAEFVPQTASRGYNGLLEYMSTCNSTECKCDIGVGSWWQHKSRIGVHFLPSHGFDSLSVTTSTRNIKALGDVTFFFKAFRVNVWFAIGGTWFLFIILKIMDPRFCPTTADKPSDQPKSVWQSLKNKMLWTPLLFRIRKAVQSIFEKQFGRPRVFVKGEERSTRQWFLNFIIVLCALILTLIYEASMTSKMVQVQPQSNFKTIESLINNPEMPYRETCFVDGDMVKNFWESLVSKKCTHENDTVLDTARCFNQRSDLMNDLLNNSPGTCQYMIADHGTAKDLVAKKYCQQLELTGESFYNLGVSFIMRKAKHLEWKKNILYNISLSLRDEESFRYLDDYIDSRFQCKENRKTRIGFNTLLLFFCMGYGACGIIAIYMIFDKQWKTVDKVQEKGSDQSTEEV